MPTVLRQFPQQNRSGTQQTPYIAIPAGVTGIHLEGQASAATLSDGLNQITFTILASPDGTDANARTLDIEVWQGGTSFDKVTQQLIPTPIDVAFGLDARAIGSQISLRAVFSRTINVGATVSGLP
jgi:hypothetical protein